MLKSHAFKYKEYIEQRILFLIWSREHAPLRVLFFYALSELEVRESGGVQPFKIFPLRNTRNRPTFLRSHLPTEIYFPPTNTPYTRHGFCGTLTERYELFDLLNPYCNSVISVS